MKTALILIDIQNGNMPLFESDKASLNAKKVLDKFRENNELI